MKKLIKTICSEGSTGNQYRSTLAILLLGVLGTFLRLYLIRDQIPLNDEWHGLLYAALHPLSYLLGNASFTATCIPLNIYRWILLHTVGWSELGLLLPSLLSGILALFLFPPIVRKTHGRVPGIVFAFLMAISPLLTFYSRVGRPYSMPVFLLFLSIYSAGFWLLSNKRKYLWTYILSSALAVYFHPVAVVSIFVPLAAGGACSFFNKHSDKPFSVPEIQPSRLAIVLTGVVLIVFSALAIGPSLATTQSLIAGEPFPGPETWEQFLLMLFGTSSSLLAMILLCLCIGGAVILLCKNFFWGAVFALLCVLHLLMLAVGRFEYIDVAIVLARYLIILFPVCFLWVAMATEGLFSLIQKKIAVRNPREGMLWMSAITLLFVLPLLLTSPLRETYKAPNNFTNHSAFHESYKFDGWHQPYRSRMFPHTSIGRSGNISSFYRTLPEETQCLIEYPMMVGDHFNFYYYYQHHHQKRVVVGYSGAVPKRHRKDQISGNHFINNVLRTVKNKSRIRLKNVVNILDQEAVRKTGADYLIVHQNLMDEFFPGKYLFKETKTPDLENDLKQLRVQYGQPVYKDRRITVFELSGPKGAVSQ